MTVTPATIILLAVLTLTAIAVGQWAYIAALRSEAGAHRTLYLRAIDDLRQSWAKPTRCRAVKMDPLTGRATRLRRRSNNENVG